jgi:hypothetical protein
MHMKPVLAARIAGWLSLAAMVALTSPGVRVVRADEQPAPVSELPAGPACSAENLGTAVVSIALPSEAEAEKRRERRQIQVVPLDGGGNRYGRAESPAPPARSAE